MKPRSAPQTAMSHPITIEASSLRLRTWRPGGDRAEVPGDQRLTHSLDECVAGQEAVGMQARAFRVVIDRCP